MAGGNPARVMKSAPDSQIRMASQKKSRAGESNRQSIAFTQLHENCSDNQGLRRRIVDASVGPLRGSIPSITRRQSPSVRPELASASPANVTIGPHRVLQV